MLRAVIFDFNGIVIDDEHIHFRVFQKVLREEGFDFTEQDYFGTYLGLDDRGCFAAVMTDRGRPTGIAEVHELVERKAAYYLRELERNMILFPGVVDFVGRMAQRSALAVCSGARQHEIEYVLDKSGMRKHFSVIISADQVHSGKPDPTGYLATLNALRRQEGGLETLKAAECLVIEDAPNGIRAAHAAGMVCMAVTNSRSHGDLTEADLIVESLDHVDTEQLVRLFVAAP